MSSVKKVMTPEQFDRLASGYERYSVRSGEQTQDDNGTLVELNDALSREAALREELAKKDRALEDLLESNSDMTTCLAAAEQRNADDLRDAERYRELRKFTPYRFKKMQDASVTDGGDVLYFHADKFDALMDAELTKPTESGASDKCASDGGTCGLGGQCADCPHKESGASDLDPKIIGIVPMPPMEYDEP